MSYNSLAGIASHSDDANALCGLNFQDTSGTAADDFFATANDGTISGMGANPTVDSGPNGYLPSAFDFDGTDDFVTLDADTVVGGALARTYIFWIKLDSFDTGTNRPIMDVGSDFGGDTGQQFQVFAEDNAISIGFSGHRVITTTTPLVTGTWYHIAIVVPSGASTTSDVKIYINAVDQTLSDEAGSSQTLNTNGTENRTFGRRFTAPSTFNYLDGKSAGYFAYSRAFSATEVGQHFAGPEPENTLAPTVSGETAQGSTLTANNGTWALPSPFASGSNGSLAYSIQWTRDGVNIDGATSATYVTQAADVGTAIGFKELASNDGGSDSAEETSSSNTITVTASASGTYRLSAQLLSPTIE